MRLGSRDGEDSGELEVNPSSWEDSSVRSWLDSEIRVELEGGMPRRGC